VGTFDGVVAANDLSYFALLTNIAAANEDVKKERSCRRTSMMQEEIP
jgi:hypothetical protein